MPNISVILSAYNDEKTVKRCLESVFAQENTDMRIECLVVDDCSTDATLDIIRHEVGAYKGGISFRILRHKIHHGLSRTRNTGLDRAMGDYVMFVNATDVLRPGCMDVFMVNLMRYWDVDVIAGNVFNSVSGQNLFPNLTSTMALRGRGQVICQEMLANHLYLFAWNKLIRRDLLMSLNARFDETMAYADIQWAFQVFSNVSSIALLPEVTYEYMSHDMGTIGMAEKRVNALLSSYAATSEYLIDHCPRPEGEGEGYYFAHQLFVYGMLEGAELVLKEYNVLPQVKRELSNVRSKLVSQTRKDGQKRLSLYFVQDASLFSGIIKLPAFKRFGEVVADVVKQLGTLVGKQLS